MEQNLRKFDLGDMHWELRFENFVMVEMKVFVSKSVVKLLDMFEVKE